MAGAREPSARRRREAARVSSLHPCLEAAARGELPPWAAADADRRRHMARVAELLGTWAEEDGQPLREQARWRAMGYLHDALKEAPPEGLRALVPDALAGLPEPVLHGPAVAERLRREGVDDEPFLRALAWHTIGHPDLDRAGRALFAADFLEPGRDLENAWRGALRARMPAALDHVVAEIVRARIVHLLERDRPVRPETMAFWNAMVEGEPWARASEV